jgi:DNA polymerase-1
MYLALDVEGTYGDNNLPWMEGSYLSTLAVVTSEGEERTWVFRHDENKGLRTDREQIEEVVDICSRANYIIAHNAKFDIHWLLSFFGVEPNKIFCTSVAEYLLTGQRHSFPRLEDVAQTRLGRHKLDQVKILWEQGVPTHKVPLDLLLEYNLEDTRLTLEIARQQMAELRSEGMWTLFELEMNKLRHLITMEQHGLLINEEERSKLEEQLTHDLGRIDRRIQEIAGRTFNVGSTEQLSSVLFGGPYKVCQRAWLPSILRSGKLGGRVRKIELEFISQGIGFTPDPDTQLKGKHGIYSCDKGNLSQLKPKTTVQREMLDLLRQRSELSQQLNTFVIGIREVVGQDSKVRPNFNNTRTITGRLSCSRPNLQNQSRGSTFPARRIFESSKGLFVSVDFSQLEWRIAAFLSQCPVMLEEIYRGEDQHAGTGSDIFNGSGDRVTWKTFNFRMIYGGSPYSYYMDYRMPSFSLGKWTQIVESFYEKYYGLAEWHDQLEQEVRKNNGWLQNPTGRKFHFRKYPTKLGMNYKRTQIVNYPVQSLAAEVVNMGMKYCDEMIERRNYSAVMCNQIHDDIMYDSHKHDATKVADTMLDVYQTIPVFMKTKFDIDLNIPLDGEAKIGPNWLEMEKYNVL